MRRSTVVIDLARQGSLPGDLAAGGVFVPGCTLRIAEECELVVQSADRRVSLPARVVYVDEDRGAGLELIGFSNAMRAQLAELAQATRPAHAAGPAHADDDDLALPTDCVFELSGEPESTDPTGPTARGDRSGPAASAIPEPRDSVHDLTTRPTHMPPELIRTAAMPARGQAAIGSSPALRPRPVPRGSNPAVAIARVTGPAPGAAAAPSAVRGAGPMPPDDSWFTADDAAAGVEDDFAAEDARVRLAPSASAAPVSGPGDDDLADAAAAREFFDADAARVATALARHASAVSDEFSDADAAAASGNDFVDDEDVPDTSDEIDAAIASALAAQTAATGTRVPRNVHERLRGLTLIAQHKLAAAGELHERIVLERLYGKNVWEILLRNPRLTPPEVARIARYGSLPRVLLEIILANNAWLQVPEVRRALLANPRLGADQIIKVLRLTPKHELRLAAVQTAYPYAVRNAAKMLLRGE